MKIKCDQCKKVFELSEDEIIELKHELPGEFYFIEELKKIFINKYGELEIKKFNARTIKQLGYKVYANYVIDKKYSNSNDYHSRQNIFDFLKFQLFEKTVFFLNKGKKNLYQEISLIVSDLIVNGYVNYVKEIGFTTLNQKYTLTNINLIKQLLAYYIAEFLGKDVDQPRNLAKSVTVE